MLQNIHNCVFVICLGCLTKTQGVVLRHTYRLQYSFMLNSLTANEPVVSNILHLHCKASALNHTYLNVETKVN